MSAAAAFLRRLARPALACALAGTALAAAADGQKIGSVDTAFQWIGRDHDILVEAYDDPAVVARACIA